MTRHHGALRNNAPTNCPRVPRVIHPISQNLEPVNGSTGTENPFLWLRSCFNTLVLKIEVDARLRYDFPNEEVDDLEPTVASIIPSRYSRAFFVSSQGSHRPSPASVSEPFHSVHHAVSG